jgi:predicted transcriptional regulator
MRMQLDRLVQFHKALGDVTRLRIISLLKGGPLCGQEIAERMGVSAPTISHHMKTLREAGIVGDRREKNTIYFYLNEKNLARGLAGVLEINEHDHLNLAEEEKKKNEEREITNNFFDANGRLKNIPAQRKKKIIVLRRLLAEFKVGIAYSEKEVNEIIKKYHDDFATIRREFIMNHFMHRENGYYTLNPQEMWAKP